MLKTALAAMFTLAVPAALLAQHTHGAPAKGAKAHVMTDAQKIQSAMSAAPAAIAKDAAIMDWPETPDGQPRQLRAGTNGWVCYPTTPQGLGGQTGEDPMCLDKAWQAWGEAWVKKAEPPKITSPGIAYMLRGDKGGSNTDPYAKERTADNQWVVSPPHIMMLVPDLASLEGYPTDPKNGGPWVMYKGTPYVHLMIPVSATKAVVMK